MNPRFLKSFLTVARTGNMSRAAEQLHLAQSSVSDQIQSLETELGVALFERTKSGLVLTTAGLTLQPYAKEVLMLLDDAKSALREPVSGGRETLVVGALETVAARMLPMWLSRFRETHPDIDIKLRIAGTGDLLRMIKDGDIDAAFCFDPGELEGVLAQRLVSREPLVLIGDTSAAAKGDGIPALGRLQDAKFIATPKGCVFRQMLDETMGRLFESPAQIATEVESIATIVNLVAAGQGVALVPKIAVADALEQDKIVELPWQPSTYFASLILVWRRRRVQAPALRHLLSSLHSDQAMTAVAMQDGSSRKSVGHRKGQGFGDIVRLTNASHG